MPSLPPSSLADGSDVAGEKRSSAAGVAGSCSILVAGIGGRISTFWTDSRGGDGIGMDDVLRRRVVLGSLLAVNFDATGFSVGSFSSFIFDEMDFRGDILTLLSIST